MFVDHSYIMLILFFILVYQGCSKYSKLESIYKQSILTTKELIISGHGKASLLHIQEYFMGE